MTAIIAGGVVAAPIAASVSPIARRRAAESRSEMSRPTPIPSTARVATTKPNVGTLSTRVFMQSHDAT